MRTVASFTRSEDTTELDMMVRIPQRRLCFIVTPRRSRVPDLYSNTIKPLRSLFTVTIEDAESGVEEAL
jgi:hypothetical protein